MTHDADAPAYRHPITHPTHTPRGPGASALRDALDRALLQWEMYADANRGDGRELDYLVDGDDTEARLYQQCRSTLAAARADAEPALSVERLRALSDAATPGVWTRDADYIVAPRPWVGARPDEVIGRMSPTVAGHWDHPRDEANAALVVAAVNFARAALATGAPTDGDGSRVCAYPGCTFRREAHGSHLTHAPSPHCHPFTPAPTPPPADGTKA